MRRLALGLALAALLVPSAHADTQAILGLKMDVRNPSDASPTRRAILVFAQEAAPSDNLLVGDPTVDGATLRVVTRGDTTLYDETYDLPAAGWKVTLTRHDWPVFKSYVYSNALTGGPVRSLTIKSSGWHTPEGQPPPEEPVPGQFRLKARLLGKDGPLGVVPPNPGTEAGIVLTLGTGDSYCVAFGAAAGGDILANTAARFALRRPTAEGCPGN